MTIYDKARWQIEGGIEEELVIQHFRFMFQWLNDYNLLSEEGKKTYADGIDESSVLMDEYVNEEGKKFLDKFYDSYIEQIGYGESENLEILKGMYEKL